MRRGEIADVGIFIVYLRTLPPSSAHVTEDCTSAGYSHERTWCAFGSERADDARSCEARRVSRKSYRRKNFRQPENFFPHRVGLPLEERDPLEVRELLIPGDLISPESRRALVRNGVAVKSQAEPYIAQKSPAIYMPADNEICCWTKVENFWRVSLTFFAAPRRSV